MIWVFQEVRFLEWKLIGLFNPKLSIVDSEHNLFSYKKLCEYMLEVWDINVDYIRAGFPTEGNNLGKSLQR